MIIFLYGPDSYRRKIKLGEFIREYESKHEEADLRFFDLAANTEDWLKVKDFLTQPSMFTESKVAVIKESGAVSEKDWLRILKSQTETPKTFLLISDGEKPGRPLDFLLKKPVAALAFLELEGGTLDFFIKREAEKIGLDFTREAFDFFRAFIVSGGERSWRVVNELQKIFLARPALPNGAISLSQIRSVVDWSEKENFYFLAGLFFAAAPVAKKLKALEKLFSDKEEPAKIFNFLAYKADGAAAAKLADYDVSVKSGGLGYEEALLDFIIP